MTAILGFSFQNKLPILLGDLLITRSGKPPDRAVDLPTGIDSREVFGGNDSWAISALTQKIAVLPPRFAFAWAGSLMSARDFYGEAKSVSKKDNLSLEAARELIRQIDSAELAIIGCHVSKSDGLWLIPSEGLSTAKAPYGQVFVAGSGDFHLRKAISKLQHFRYLVDFGNTTDTLGISVAGLWATELMRLETDTCDPLYHMFGGGYEILSMIGKNFGKIEYTMIIWEATLREDGYVSTHPPRRLFKFAYAGRSLGIHSVKISTEGDDLAARPNSPPVFVSHLGEKISAEELDSLQSVDLHSTVTFHQVEVYGEDKEFRYDLWVPIFRNEPGYEGHSSPKGGYFALNSNIADFLAHAVDKKEKQGKSWQRLESSAAESPSADQDSD